MKLKTIFSLLVALTISINNSFSQDLSEKDIVGYWKVNDAFFEDGTRDHIGNAKTVFIFNDDNTFTIEKGFNASLVLMFFCKGRQWEFNKAKQEIRIKNCSGYDDDILIQLENTRNKTNFKLISEGVATMKYDMQKFDDYESAMAASARAEKQIGAAEAAEEAANTPVEVESEIYTAGDFSNSKVINVSSNRLERYQTSINDVNWKKEGDVNYTVFKLDLDKMVEERDAYSREEPDNLLLYISNIKKFDIRFNKAPLLEEGDLFDKSEYQRNNVLAELKTGRYSLTLLTVDRPAEVATSVNVIIEKSDLTSDDFEILIYKGKKSEFMEILEDE